MTTRSRFCGHAADASRCGPPSLRSELAALEGDFAEAWSQGIRANRRLDFLAARARDEGFTAVADAATITRPGAAASSRPRATSSGAPLVLLRGKKTPGAGRDDRSAPHPAASLEGAS